MIRERLTYANVVATLALFLALGGGAYAAKQIRGKDIADRSIGARDIRKGALTGTEIARGAISRAKLSRGLRAQLRPDGDDEPFPEDDFPIDPGFGLPGEPGPPGEPGEPGDPGPAGTACDAGSGLLCADADLPAGHRATLQVGAVVLSATAYRTSCPRTGDCVVVLAGPAPGKAAGDWLGAPAPGNGTLTVGPQAGAPDRTFELTRAQPEALINQTDRWQLTVSAQSVRER